MRRENGRTEMSVAGTRTDSQNYDSKLPAFFYRLSARAQRTYLLSLRVERFELVPGPGAFAALGSLSRTLETGDPTSVGIYARLLAAEMCRSLGVAPVAVQVRGVRPRNTRGELHGLFYPRDLRRAIEPNIVLWMKTAQRHDIVKPKTFVRTLMHEVTHYLDYALLRLDDSFHSAGFFRRESSLVRALFPTAKSGPPPGQLS